MLHTKFHCNRITVLENNDNSFYHILAWQNSWSSNLHPLYKFSVPCSRKLSYGLQFQITQQIFGEKNDKSMKTQ